MSEETRKLIHDIRNPLNNISINAELGKLVLERKGDIAKAKEIFTTIINACKSCSDELEKLKEHMDDPQDFT